MPYTDYLKQRALAFYAQGLAPPGTADALAAEGLIATRQGLAKLIKRYFKTGTIRRCTSPGSGRPSYAARNSCEHNIIRTYVHETANGETVTSVLPFPFRFQRSYAKWNGETVNGFGNVFFDLYCIYIQV